MSRQRFQCRPHGIRLKSSGFSRTGDASSEPRPTGLTPGAFTYENQSATEMHLGRSFGRPAPFGWAVEVFAEARHFHAAHYNTRGGEVEKRDP
ncbi:hypothetical protein P3502_20845, partial [Vibrio parahaemolyticus]|nr:hypothetical protein [Vibrio parahaemolyticus]MDG3033760.1 hypothetical protein [Vibrio parahaemolyticus]